MTIKLKHLTLVLLIAICSCRSTVNLVSYNIRYDNPEDKPNSWDERKVELTALLAKWDAAIFGLQEALHHQVSFIQKQTGYSFIGVGRDDGKTAGEYSPIFYDPNRFDLLNQQTVWLSPNPDRPSVGWDAAMERICTFGNFVHKKSNDTIFVLNAHFDHIGDTARYESAALILEIIKTNVPQHRKCFVMGDLNCEPQSQPIQLLVSELEDPSSMTPQGLIGPKGTYNGFQKDILPDRRIDYILSKNIILQKYEHIDAKRKNLLWPSDHLPVLATTRL